jgi:two-component system chemotaxis response regulator CheB
MYVRAQHPYPYRLQSDFDIVAMAASSGGLNAVSTLLSGLPGDFPVPIILVQHLHPKRLSCWPELLQRRTALAVKWAEQGEALVPQTVYVAPPDCHVAVTPERRVSLSHGAKVNFSRPAADPLFQSVANAFRSRAIGVVLTGQLYDGAQGLDCIKRLGGRTLVQEPATCAFFSMPRAAMLTGSVDFDLPIERLGCALVALTMAPGGAALFFKAPLQKSGFECHSSLDAALARHAAG